MKDLITIVVLNMLPFCKFKNAEIGIASGYFAGDAWCISDEAFKGISGQSFGWYDWHGTRYCDSKHNFSRPDHDEVVKALRERSALLDIAIAKGYAAVVSEDSY
jgi:hypothetical protein